MSSHKEHVTMTIAEYRERQRRRSRRLSIIVAAYMAFSILVNAALVWAVTTDEAARVIRNYLDTGNTSFKSLQQQQIEAWRLK